MKIGILQFAPRCGDVEGNMRRAERVLKRDLLGVGGRVDGDGGGGGGGGGDAGTGAGGNDCESRGIERRWGGELDVLVLPEMAFSGYNFPNLESIIPYLEPTAAGPSTLWARRTAARLGCNVVVGYPEISTPAANKVSDPSSRRPMRGLSAPASNSTDSHSDDNTGRTDDMNGYEENPDERKKPTRYNSLVMVSPSGKILAHYRKSYLYYTDEKWASEGSGFYASDLPICRPTKQSIHLENDISNDIPNDSHHTPSTAISSSASAPPAPRPTAPSRTAQKTTKTSLAICMDLNPYRFLAPLHQSHDFADHILNSRSELAIVSMAWLTYEVHPPNIEDWVDRESPEGGTLGYWVERFAPLVSDGSSSSGKTGTAEGEGEVAEWDGGSRVVVLANRTGSEAGVSYAGSSCVMGFSGGMMEEGASVDREKSGSRQGVRVWGVLGRGEERCLVVDTEEEPRWVLRTRRIGEGDGEGM
ncbi:MAG: Carbon-nitrogen hydrolase [Alyxoria varia]|nr:MAG: Carbon-nitrogen hydrolase [Alyxoria varia]